MIKTGIFGGSFNPIHNGHIALAKQILERTDLEEIWLMVSPQNPLKNADSLADDNYRLKMVEAAVKDIHGLKASDFEFNMPRPSYMIDTLTSLREKYPDRVFSLIIGADNWVVFNKWHRWNEIINQFRIIVYPREGTHIDVEQLPQNVTLTDTQLYNISSTEIRQRMAEGKSVSHLVPPEIIQILKI